MAGILEFFFGKEKTEETKSDEPILSSRDLAIENLKKQAESARIAQAPAIQKAQLEAARRAAEVDKFKEHFATMTPEEKAKILRGIIVKSDDAK